MPPTEDGKGHPSRRRCLSASSQAGRVSHVRRGRARARTCRLSRGQEASRSMIALATGFYESRNEIGTLRDLAPRSSIRTRVVSRDQRTRLRSTVLPLVARSRSKRRHEDVSSSVLSSCLPATPIFSYRVTATLSIRSDASIQTRKRSGRVRR